MSPDQQPPPLQGSSATAHLGVGSQAPSPGGLSAGSGLAWPCGHATKGTPGLKGVRHLRPLSSQSPLAAGSVRAAPPPRGAGSHQEPGATQGLSLEPSSQVPVKEAAPEPAVARQLARTLQGCSEPTSEAIKVLIMHMRQRPDASWEQRKGRRPWEGKRVGKYPLPEGNGRNGAGSWEKRCWKWQH